MSAHDSYGGSLDPGFRIGPQRWSMAVPDVWLAEKNVHGIYHFTLCTRHGKCSVNWRNHHFYSPELGTLVWCCATVFSDEDDDAWANEGACKRSFCFRMVFALGNYYLFSDVTVAWAGGQEETYFLFYMMKPRQMGPVFTPRWSWLMEATKTISTSYSRGGVGDQRIVIDVYRWGFR